MDFIIDSTANLRNTSNDYVEIGSRNTSSRILLIFVCKIVSIILTACLNSYLIYIFGFVLKKKTFSNLIFLSIALSDFIVGTLSMTSQLVLDYVIHWPLDRVSCLISIYMTYAMPDTTIMALLILTFHRYMLLKYPFRVNENLTKVNLFKLFCPWVVATGFWIVSLCFMVNCGQWSMEKCDITPSVNFKLVKVTLFGYIPLVLMILINFIIIVGLKQKTKRFLVKRKAIRRKLIVDKEGKRQIQENGLIQNNNSNNGTKISSIQLKNLQHLKLMRKDRRAAICIFALTMSIFFTQIVYLISWPLYQHLYIYRVGVWLSYLTSLTNPLFLYIFHEKVKHELYKKRLWCL